MDLIVKNHPFLCLLTFCLFKITYFRDKLNSLFISIKIKVRSDYFWMHHDFYILKCKDKLQIAAISVFTWFMVIGNTPSISLRLN